MSETHKKLAIASMVIAILVAISGVTDLILGIPFGGTDHTFMMDILFVVCGAIVAYLGWDSYRELR